VALLDDIQADIVGLDDPFGWFAHGPRPATANSRLCAYAPRPNGLLNWLQTMYFSRYWQLRHPDRAFCKNASSALPAHNGSCEHDNISEIVIGKDRDARNPAQALSGVSSIAEGWGTGVHFGHGTLEQKPFARQHTGAGDRPRRWCNGACPIWTSRVWNRAPETDASPTRQ
jgi:hypothetical protein